MRQGLKIATYGLQQLHLEMSTTRFLLLALAGLLLASFPSRCSCDDHRSRELADDCQPSGSLQPSESHSCDDCCEAGRSYPTYECSPATSESTEAIMTLNDFEAGGDGGDPSKCDEKFHKNMERVVALSTGWYAEGGRCGRNIRIRANGMSVLARVVDECDSLHGCDSEHAFQPPCRPNIVDASQAVWDELGITGEEVGEVDITW